MKHIYLTLFFLFGGLCSVMAQKDHSVEKDTQKNQVQLTLTDGAEKYYNTDDVQKIKFEEKQVKVIQTAGDDVFDNQVENIAFFKAVKPAGPTKADLIGTWETKYMHDYDYYALKFTENEMSILERYSYGDQQLYTTTIPYTWKDGVITLKYPASDWSEAYEETKTVSFMYDKSVLVLKSNPWEDESLEQAEVWFKEDKTPDTSDAKLDGKWFAYHRGNKSEANLGLWINGDKAEFVIGAWATRMVGPYTYENGVLYLHPTEYYFGRDRDDWGYGRIDPATLECSSWEKVSANPGLIEELTGGGEAYPETFVFFVNGDEAYGWYANEPHRFYKQ